MSKDKALVTLVGDPPLATEIASSGKRIRRLNLV
jgi:hypothetical protein